MFARGKRSSRIWKPKGSQSFSVHKADQLLGDQSFSGLKSTTKKIAIMSRLQQQQLKRDISFRHNRITSKQKTKRPQTSTAAKISDMGLLKKAYLKQKQANAVAMSQKSFPTEKTQIKLNQNIKQGLLGEFSKYQSMSKRELIEKLISLQYLANNIFKKNKVLQEKIKQLENIKNN